MSHGSERSIEHRGFVERFTNNSVIVRIISESACASCHAKGACSAADMQDKEIEIYTKDKKFAPGEIVSVVMDQSQGFKALMIGYVYPFILVFAGLLCANAAGLPELSCGLLAIGLLFPYYLLVYLYRNKLRKDFNFSIRKIM
jgi:sigma-E factor negative regulatory protein RseC